MIAVLDNNLIKTPEMTTEQYLWQVGQCIDAGHYKSWEYVCDIVNQQVLGNKTEKYKGESAWRKKYQAAKKFYENCFVKMKDNEYEYQIKKMNRELEINKIKFRDQRNAWQRQNYTAARCDEVLDILEDKLIDIGREKFDVVYTPIIYNEDTTLIVCLSDLHIGQTFDSHWGKYNVDVAKERLNKYLIEINKVAIRHGVNNICVISLGDQVSGNIHKTIQITNKENVIDQIKIATELIASFCAELCKRYKVSYYAALGNHSRLDSKDNALKDERLDEIVNWSVCNLLGHLDNFTNNIDSRIDSTLGAFKIGNTKYAYVHGDMDNISKSNINSLIQMLGEIPDAVICGHRHSPALTTIGNTTVYQSGSLPGSGDDYTVQGRMVGKASQLIMVCNENGVECIYNPVLE